MNVIDRVKELLAAADGEEHGLFREDSDWDTIKGSKRQWALRAAKKKLYDIAPVLAQALVASQEALVNIDLSDEATLDAADAGEQVIVSRAAAVWREARDALRLDGLAKAMKR